MGAPNIVYTTSHNRISNETGKDRISVTFYADAEYAAFECRAVKTGEDWGIGKGALIASFSQTPANTERTFDIYDDFLLSGDGDYTVFLYVQAPDGSWNDTIGFIPSGADSALVTADGLSFLCRKGDTGA